MFKKMNIRLLVGTALTVMFLMTSCIDFTIEDWEPSPNSIDLTEDDVKFFGEIGRNEEDFYNPVSMCIKTIGTDDIMVVADRSNKNIIKIDLGLIQEGTLDGFTGTILNYEEYGVPFSITIDDNENIYVLAQKVDDNNIKRIKLLQYTTDTNGKPNKNPEWDKKIYPVIDMNETVSVEDKNYYTEFAHISRLASIGSEDLIISNNSSYYYTKKGVSRIIEFGPDGENPLNKERKNYRKLRNISMTNPNNEDENIWTWPDSTFADGDGFKYFSYIDQEEIEENYDDPDDIPREGIGDKDGIPITSGEPLNDTIIDVYTLNSATLDSENIFVLYIENYATTKERIDNDGLNKIMTVSKGIFKLKSFNASTGEEVEKYTFVGNDDIVDENDEPYISYVPLGGGDNINNEDYQFYHNGWLMDVNSISLNSTGDILYVLKYNQGYIMRFQRDGLTYKFMDSIDIRVIDEFLREPMDIEFYSDDGTDYLFIMDSGHSRLVRVALN